MLQLTTRQQKIMEHLRNNRTLHKGRHAVKSEVAHKYAQFFELTALAQVGAISRDVDEKWYYVNTSSIGTPGTDEMFTGERFGGTTPITVEKEKVKLTERQEKIVAYFRENGTPHKGRYSIKDADAYKYARFAELTVLQQIGTITYNPEQKCFYVNAAAQTPPREKWDTGGIADYVPDVESKGNHGHWQPVAPPHEMFAGKRFGGTTPITAGQESIARTKYMDARHNADELRALARAKAFIMAPDGFREFQNSVNRFYEAIEIEARSARELFDLLSDQTYD